MVPPLELLKLPGADTLVKQAKQILSAMEEAPRETFLRFERAVEGDMSCVDNVRERVREDTVANQSSLSGFCDDSIAVGC
nr:exocyst complex component EXO70B1-like [Ipomoea batatas]